jgi:murein DD-endopeptidase MepM/ murein hydrolase activator NlpD
MRADPTLSIANLLPAVETRRPNVAGEDPSQALDQMFAEVLISEMRRSLPKDGLFSGREMEMFQSFFDTEIAKDIARTGRLGLGAALKRAEGARSFSRFEAGSAPPHLDGSQLPVDGGRLTSSFGERHDPFHGHKRQHRGVDIAAPTGTPIRAIASGTVRFSGRSGGYGNVVIVAHPDGTETRYAHCRSLDVRAGQQVSAGDPIATVGSTGRSTGPHLHLEVRKGGAAIDPVAHFGWSRTGAQLATR